MQFAAAISRGRNSGVMPLEHPLCVGEAPVLLGMGRSGKEEDLRCDVLGSDLSARYLGRITPELCRFGNHEVAHNEPVETAEAGAMERSMHRPHRWVLSHDEVALDPPVCHIGDRGHV
jgi:hypothetical protein